MNGFEFIDVHVHLLRNVQQERLVFPRPGVPDEWLVRTPERQVEFMKRWGISYTVLPNAMDTAVMLEQRMRRLGHMASEKEEQETRARLKVDLVRRFREFNDWACELGKQYPQLIPFVGIDPVLFEENTLPYFEEWVKKGTKGIKIHPGQIGAKPDHPILMSVYQRCQELGLPILTDSGLSHAADHGGIAYGEPVNWTPVLSTFPRLKLIMAHFCSGFWDERIALAERFKDNLVFDISGGMQAPGRGGGAGFTARDGHRALPVEDGMRVFRKVGIDRLLFASDGSGISFINYAEQIMALDFTQEEKQLIFSGNAKRFLKLK